MKPLTDNLKSKLFSELAIGDKFSDGRSYGMGAQNKKLHELIYQKTTKSKAIVIDGTFCYKRIIQNKGTYHYTPNTIVFVSL